MAAGATLVGVNQRDLVTFAVDTRRAERVAAAIPAEVVAVAESGVTVRRRGPAGRRRLPCCPGWRDAGAVGDRAAAVAGLVGHPVGPRALGWPGE